MTDYKKKWDKSDLIPEELKDSKKSIIEELDVLHESVDQEKVSKKMDTLLKETEFNLQLLY